MYRKTHAKYTEKVRRAESTGRLPAHYERKGETLLVLVLTAFVAVADPTDGVGAQENDLRDALVGVDLGRQRRRVADLDGHAAAPFRLQRRHVHDDAAPRIRAFADTNTQNVSRDLEVLDRLRQGEAVGRDQAVVPFDVHEGGPVEVLGIDDGAQGVGEDL